MAEYYVVRDKNTGLYFRGKGINRWGKYYNQASIYRVKANAENTIKDVSWRGEQAEIVPIHIIKNTADVVEVVRCKDCVHYVPNYSGGKCALHSDYYGEHEVEMEADDYCSCGRREW